MTFLNLLKKGNVIIWDGGFGTTITNRLNKTFHLSLEELNLKNPELVLAVHRSFLESGAQVIKTNTFGADRITLSEHGLKDRVR